MNLFDIFQNANGGNAYANLANQFGIGPDQAQKAVEAMMPAFSAGMQQQAQSLEGWGNILSAMSGAQNASSFLDSDGDGIPDSMEEEGNAALGSVFGSPEATQAMAQQAAQFAGIPATLMQQMLPMIAAMVMGGVLKGATNSGLGGMLGQMMGGAGGSGLGAGLPGGLGGMLGQMMGGAQAGQPAGGMLGGLLNTMLGGGQQASAAPAVPEKAMNMGLDMLKGMFDTGQRAQNTQIDAFSRILDQFAPKK